MSGNRHSAYSLVAARRGAALDGGGGDAGHDAHQQPVADRLGDHAASLSAAQRVRAGVRERERDDERRHTEPVVEAALDVEALPERRREALVGHVRVTERRLG